VEEKTKGIKIVKNNKTKNKEERKIEINKERKK
jgi:hypothetical protein